MKNTLLAIVTVLALLAAGVGGTLADFNDYEVSKDNTFKMGSMDLTVSDADGNEYQGGDVPALVIIDNGWPDCSKDRSWDLHNAGENEQAAPWVYIHFKNLDCTWVNTKVSATTPYAYISVGGTPPHITKVQGPPVPKDYIPPTGAIGINEPQYVAIFGGVAGEDAAGAPVEVPGIGDAAICLLSRNVTVTSITYSKEYPSGSGPVTWVDVPAADKTILDLDRFDKDSPKNGVQLDELICKQIYMFQMKGCNRRLMNMSLVGTNLNESEFNLDLFPAGAKWVNWPTNATQNQKLEFDMAFEMFGQATKPFLGD